MPLTVVHSTMTIEDLKNLANDYLQAAENAEPERLRERVMVAHTRSVTKKLLALLAKKEPDDVLAGLEALLKDNWQDAQRTMLCYTATPESDITRLLIKTAEFIAQSRQERPVSVFELLMPGVATESLHDSYPDLHTGDVHTLLSHHVLGCGSYLIPVQLLAELHVDKRTPLYNPYYDFQRHTSSQAKIDEAELERLYQHSPETRALKEAYDTYQTHIEDKSTLLDNLLHLCTKLHMNSVDMQGTEDDAGSGAYPAIFAFNEYYTSLAEAEKARIPQEVRGEINKLLALSSDQEQNKNATANLETCLATRRGELLEAIKGQEVTLGNIAVSDAHKQNLTNAAKQHIAQCQHELKTQDSYRGNDSFGLTRGLLKRLDIHLSVSSLADLHDFLSLNPEEITELGQNEALKGQIANQIKTLEDWIVLVIETPLPKLEALMALIGERLANTFIQKPVDVSALLMTLTPERTNVVCGVINDKLPDIIKDGWGFSLALEELPIAQRTSVYSAMNDKLPEIIQNSEDFGRALQYLTSAQCNSVCVTLNDKLPNIIQNVGDFTAVLEYLTPGQRTSVYSAMNIKLPEMIQNGEDFGLALKHLAIEQRTSVYSAMKNKLPEIVESGWDLSRALEYLAPGQRTSVCVTLNNQLSDVIQNGWDFGWALKYLTTAQRAGIYSAMNNKLPEIIENDRDLGWALHYLTPEQCTGVCIAMNDKLPEIIQNGDNVQRMLRSLTVAQRTSICIAMHDRLPDKALENADANPKNLMALFKSIKSIRDEIKMQLESTHHPLLNTIKRQEEQNLLSLMIKLLDDKIAYDELSESIAHIEYWLNSAEPHSKELKNGWTRLQSHFQQWTSRRQQNEKVTTLTLEAEHCLDDINKNRRLPLAEKKQQYFELLKRLQTLFPLLRHNYPVSIDHKEQYIDMLRAGFELTGSPKFINTLSSSVDLFYPQNKRARQALIDCIKNSYQQFNSQPILNNNAAQNPKKRLQFTDKKNIARQPTQKKIKPTLKVCFANQVNKCIADEFKQCTRSKENGYLAQNGLFNQNRHQKKNDHDRRQYDNTDGVEFVRSNSENINRIITKKEHQ